jgi:hypothetical protein
VNDPIATLRADIDPIARAGLEKATELGNHAVAVAKQKTKAKRPKRRKWWLGPVVALAIAGVVIAVKRTRETEFGGDSYKANGARMGLADSAPEPQPAAVDAH